MLSVADIASRYAYPPQLTQPWVRTNFVSSIDGAAQDAAGVTAGLGGPDDTKIFAVLRSMADVILVGAGTARREGYGPVKPEEIHAELRPDAAAVVPPIAVVSESLDIPGLLVAPHQILITHRASDSAKRERLAQTMDVIVAGDNAIDWDEVFMQLAERNLNRVLCEGGPQLQGDLIATDHIDELCLSVATVLVGGEAKRIAIGPISPARSMRLIDTIAGDGVLATRWIRVRSE